MTKLPRAKTDQDEDDAKEREVHRHLQVRWGRAASPWRLPIGLPGFAQNTFQQHPTQDSGAHDDRKGGAMNANERHQPSHGVVPQPHAELEEQAEAKHSEKPDDVLIIVTLSRHGQTSC
jgi:hypothetical protein